MFGHDPIVGEHSPVRSDLDWSPRYQPDRQGWMRCKFWAVVETESRKSHPVGLRRLRNLTVYTHINLLVVIALFSSHFELENRATCVNLIMDLAPLKGRLRDACGTEQWGHQWTFGEHVADVALEAEHLHAAV